MNLGVWTAIGVAIGAATEYGRRRSRGNAEEDRDD